MAAWLHPGDTKAAGGPGLSRALERVAHAALVLLATSSRHLDHVAGLTLRPDWAGGALAVGLLLALSRLARPSVAGVASGP